MKLQELAAPSATKKIARVYENYFGADLPVTGLSTGQTRHLLRRVRAVLKEHQNSTQRHFSEQNPAYLQLMIMEQALQSRLDETLMQSPQAATNPATQNGQAAQTKTVDVKDPKLAAALKKSQAGQTLTPDEQKLVADAALTQQESRLRSALRVIKESEVQQAQVVLAAQDMVDQMQSMLEDTTEIQFKELPALVDSIRNQIGMDQAVQFQSDATAALTGLVQNLQGAKQQLEQALGVVTGQAQAAPALDAAITGATQPAAAAAGAGEEEVDLSLDANLPAEEPEQPAGTQGALGRERR